MPATARALFPGRDVDRGCLRTRDRLDSTQTIFVVTRLRDIAWLLGEYETGKIAQELHVPPPVQYVDIAGADEIVFGVVGDGSVARLTWDRARWLIGEGELLDGLNPLTS